MIITITTTTTITITINNNNNNNNNVLLGYFRLHGSGTSRWSEVVIDLV